MSIDSSINVNKITVGQLKDFKIEDKSAGRSFGRRFVLKKHDGTSSKEVVFKDIFKRVEKINKKATSLEDLRAVKDFLGKLETANLEDAVDYSNTSVLYKFRTWFHRLFDFGSHSDKIGALREDIDEKYARLDLASLSTKEVLEYIETIEVMPTRVITPTVLIT